MKRLISVISWEQVLPVVLVLATVSTMIGASAAADVGLFSDDDQVDNVENVLELTPSDGPNGEFASIDDSGELTLDLSPSNDALEGDGPDSNSTTLILDVFVVRNANATPYCVWIEPFGGDSGAVEFVTTDPSVTSISSEQTCRVLEEDDRMRVGLQIDSSGRSSGDVLLESMSIRAKAVND
jgi:hypothetical protein